MRLYLWRSPSGNFGDDLNEFLWSDLAPELFADPDDGVLLVGVGSVLTRALPRARLRVVMGAGAGYAPLPSGLAGPGWRVDAVRGPLTARLIGRTDCALLDPAMLLPLLPRFRARPDGGTLFIPHWTTAEDPRWRAAAERAGLTFVDPRDDAEAVIARIAGAGDVVAESMHGAIVADAFRKPWVPVVCTHYSPFKWLDWSRSLGLPYRPVRVGADLANAGMMVRGRAFSGPDAIVEREFERFRARAAPSAAAPASAGGPDAAAAVTRINGDGRLKRMLGAVGRRIPDRLFTALAARDLRRVARAGRLLSRDERLAQRRDALLERLELLRADHAAGRL